MCGSEVGFSHPGGGITGQGPTPIRAILSNHARLRAAQMGVPTKEVKACLRDPEMTYPSKGSVESVACRGRLAVLFVDTDDVRLAITVLWRGEESRYPTGTMPE